MSAKFVYVRIFNLALRWVWGLNFNPNSIIYNMRKHQLIEKFYKIYIQILVLSVKKLLIEELNVKNTFSGKNR